MVWFAQIEPGTDAVLQETHMKYERPTIERQQVIGKLQTAPSEV